MPHFDYRRILVIGCCGAGKSTLSVKLSNILNIPVIHLDALFWKENWVESTREELDEAIKRASLADRWIMDGNYSRTIPMRLQRCDCVIFMDLPRKTCVFGVLKRIIKYYGISRPDMGKNCPERLDFEFLRYVWNFHKAQKPKLLNLLRDTEKPVIVLKSHKEASKFLEEIT